MTQDAPQHLEPGGVAQKEVAILELQLEDLLWVAGGPQIMNDDLVPS